MANTMTSSPPAYMALALDKPPEERNGLRDVRVHCIIRNDYMYNMFVDTKASEMISIIGSTHICRDIKRLSNPSDIIT